MGAVRAPLLPLAALTLLVAGTLLHAAVGLTATYMVSLTGPLEASCVATVGAAGASLSGVIKCRMNMSAAAATDVARLLVLLVAGAGARIGLLNLTGEGFAARFSNTGGFSGWVNVSLKIPVYGVNVTVPALASTLLGPGANGTYSETVNCTSGWAASTTYTYTASSAPLPWSSRIAVHGPGGEALEASAAMLTEARSGGGGGRLSPGLVAAAAVLLLALLYYTRYRNPLPLLLLVVVVLLVAYLSAM